VIDEPDLDRVAFVRPNDQRLDERGVDLAVVFVRIATLFRARCLVFDQREGVVGCFAGRLAHCVEVLVQHVHHTVGLVEPESIVDDVDLDSVNREPPSAPATVRAIPKI